MFNRAPAPSSSRPLLLSLAILAAIIVCVAGGLGIYSMGAHSVAQPAPVVLTETVAATTVHNTTTTTVYTTGEALTSTPESTVGPTTRPSDYLETTPTTTGNTASAQSPYVVAVNPDNLGGIAFACAKGASPLTLTAGESKEANGSSFKLKVATADNGDQHSVTLTVTMGANNSVKGAFITPASRQIRPDVYNDEPIAFHVGPRGTATQTYMSADFDEGNYQTQGITSMTLCLA